MMRGEACNIGQMLAQIPCGAFVLTAAHDDRIAGALVRWVQRCANEPPLVVVALPRGQAVEPLIQDHRGFALCQIGEDDRFLVRKFAQKLEAEDDPFVCLNVHRSPGGSPILDRAIGYLDCEVVRQVEVDADHRLYVGLVTHAAALNVFPPVVYVGDDGSTR